jgi:hypothetical protein
VVRRHSYLRERPDRVGDGVDCGRCEMTKTEFCPKARINVFQMEMGGVPRWFESAPGVYAQIVSDNPDRLDRALAIPQAAFVLHYCGEAYCDGVR